MKKTFFLIFAILCTHILSAQANRNTLSQQKNSTKEFLFYTPQDFSHLLGNTGFDDDLLNMHFTLYKGYVKNTNYLLEQLRALEENGEAFTPVYGALKRRLGWEFDGMRLHELYFANLGGKNMISTDMGIYHDIVNQFGSFENWKEDFIATGMMRGIGWVILYMDPYTGKLMNVWISEHDIGHLATGEVFLVMDVWEHAYLPQFGLDRKGYIEVFFDSIDWNVVSRRHIMSLSCGDF